MGIITQLPGKQGEPLARGFPLVPLQPPPKVSSLPSIKVEMRCPDSQHSPCDFDPTRPDGTGHVVQHTLPTQDCTFKALLYQEHAPVIYLPLRLGNKIYRGFICHLQSPQPHLRPWSLPPAHPFEERYGNHRRSCCNTAGDSIAARPACSTQHRRCKPVSMSFYGRKMKIACPAAECLRAEPS